LSRTLRVFVQQLRGVHLEVIQVIPIRQIKQVVLAQVVVT
jgi:hypothetical protein